MAKITINYWALVGTKQQRAELVELARQDKIRIVVETVCSYFEIDFKSLTAHTRKQKIVDIRYVLMRMLRHFVPQISYKEIGMKFKSRHKNKPLDHTTVMHGLKSVQNRMDTDDNYKLLVYKLEQQIAENLLEINHQI